MSDLQPSHQLLQLPAQPDKPQPTFLNDGNPHIAQFQSIMASPPQQQELKNQSQPQASQQQMGVNLEIVNQLANTRLLQNTPQPEGENQGQPKPLFPQRQPVMKLAGYHMHQKIPQQSNQGHYQSGTPMKVVTNPKQEDFKNTRPFVQLEESKLQNAQQEKSIHQESQDDLKFFYKTQEVFDSNKENRNQAPQINNLQSTQGLSTTNQSKQIKQNPPIKMGTSQSQRLFKHLIDLVHKGQVDQVLYEINKMQLDINSIYDENNYNQTPMFSVAFIRDEDKGVQMAQAFTDLGLQANQVDTLNQTSLFYAAREGKIKLIDFFIQNGCNVNHIDTYGQTPIFYACREGQIDVVKRLATYGADLDHIDHNGQTPIFYAIKTQKLNVISFLLKQGLNLNVSDKKGFTPKTWAKKLKKTQVIKLLSRSEEGSLQSEHTQPIQEKKTTPTKEQKAKQQLIHKPYHLLIQKDGQYEPINQEEFGKFQVENPDLAQYFDGQHLSKIEDLEIPEVPKSAQIYDSWEKAAKRLLNALWKYEYSWIFYEPVDPKQMNLPDYLQVVKEPMDFGTIKQKLTQNQYQKLQDFLYDIQLVFNNCILYNGESTPIGQMCKAVREEFSKLYKSLAIDFYL